MKRKRLNSGQRKREFHKALWMDMTLEERADQSKYWARKMAEVEKIPQRKPITLR